MFYPVESLKRGGKFYLCWVADSWPLRFATITHRQLWSQDIRKICEDLLEVIKNESGRPTNRFSLRLSSQLLRGLVRLYQRKVAVFIGDLCMMNAYVMKVTNKKWAYNVTARDTDARPELPVLVLEELEDEERVVEKIQNSGNVVANVQDITLREPTEPDRRLPLEDGFGELQMQERAMELMMRAGPAVGEQVSALSLLSADETLARSKLDASSLLPPRMEGISEHDISVFRKSMGESLLPVADFDKDIPDLPEIHPELPAPQRDKVVARKTGQNEGEQMEPAREDSAEKRRRDVREFVLEELNECPLPKRRRKIKLIRDKSTKLTSHLMATRVQNVHLDLRCQDSSDDVISTRVPVSVYLGRPARAGHRAHSNLSYTLTRLFIRNLDVTDKQPSDDRQLEQALVARPKRSVTRSEAVTTAAALEEQAPLIESELQQERQPDLSALPMEVDMTLLPTQIIATSPQHLEHSSKKTRHSGYTTFRLYQTLKELSAPDTNKENIPENQQVMGDARLTQLLQAEGLADVDVPVEQHIANVNAPLGEHQATNRQAINVDVTAVERQAVSRLPTDERSETPLGSLDRTKVSLGESDNTTDSRRFIREQWGTRGTMHRVYAAVRDAAGWGGAKRVCVPELMARAPAPPAGLRRLAAARCFTSILKLKQHGFIEILKEVGCNDIAYIRLGAKVVGR